MTGPSKVTTGDAMKDIRKLDFVLYDRPAGRSVCEHAVETIEKLRSKLIQARNLIDQGGSSADLWNLLDESIVPHPDNHVVHHLHELSYKTQKSSISLIQNSDVLDREPEICDALDLIAGAVMELWRNGHEAKQ